MGISLPPDEGLVNEIPDAENQKNAADKTEPLKQNIFKDVSSRIAQPCKQTLVNHHINCSLIKKISALLTLRQSVLSFYVR